MRTPHCFSCGIDWGEYFPCRLSDEDNPESWVQVYVCTSCWQSAERQHQARLAEKERGLLREWFPPRVQEEASV